MDSLQDGYMLRNGVKIPCIGFGTWKSPDDVVCESVKMAIQAGYRHIDGAAAYANEAGVGKGIRESPGKSCLLQANSPMQIMDMKRRKNRLIKHWNT